MAIDDDKAIIYKLLDISNLDEGIQLASDCVRDWKYACGEHNWLLIAQVSAEIALHSRSKGNTLSWARFVQLSYYLAAKNHLDDYYESPASLAMLYFRAKLMRRFGVQAVDQLLDIQEYEKLFVKYIGLTKEEIIVLLRSNNDWLYSNEMIFRLRRIKNALGSVEILVDSKLYPNESWMRDLLTYKTVLP